MTQPESEFNLDVSKEPTPLEVCQQERRRRAENRALEKERKDFFEEYMDEGHRNVMRDWLLCFRRVSNRAKKPYQASDLSAGVDLYSAETLEIPPGGRALVSTDLQIELPSNTYGQLQSRSGLAVNNGILCMPGVIDADYRGIVKCLLFNLGAETFKVQTGARVCQLICVRNVSPIDIMEVKGLSETERGSKGFGSSGTN